MAEIVQSYSNGSAIKVVYSYSQSIPNNTTTVTADLYVHRDGYGPSWANGSNVCTAYINIFGHRVMTYTASFNIGSSWVKIGGTGSYVVPNGADGSLVCNILGYFDASGTSSKLAGLEVSQNITFPTIPRASTISSAPGNYSIFDSMYIAVNRASSSFTHQMDIYFSNTNGNWTKVVTNANGHYGTDTTYYFTDDQFNTILSRVPAGTSGYYMVDLWTYAADNSVVGTKQYVYNCYCADASQPSINTYPNSTPDFNIGDNITVHMNKQRGDFTHTVTAGFGSWSATLGTGIQDNVGWNTANNAGSLYSQIPNSNVGTGGVTVYTYRGGVYVGSKGATFYAHVINSNPTLSSLSYIDTNSTVVTLTGNNQNIVQNQSNVQVTVNGASAKNYSSISSYRVQYGGKVVTSSSNVITLGTVPDNNNIVVTVYDSRGNTVQSTKSVTYTSYYSPVISSAIAKRNNDIDAASTLTFNGYVAPITVNNKSFSYCYKISTDSTYSSWTSVTPTYSSNNFSFSGSIGSYDINKSYNIQVKAADYFTSTISTILLPTAQPEISIRNNQIGINKIPENGALDVNGDIYANGINHSAYNTMPSGNGSLDYWKSIRQGVYFCTPGKITGGTGQPTDYGIVEVFTNTGGDGQAIWHEQLQGSMRRLGWNSSIMGSWKRVYDDEYNPTVGGYTTANIIKAYQNDGENAIRAGEHVNNMRNSFAFAYGGDVGAPFVGSLLSFGGLWNSVYQVQIGCNYGSSDNLCYRSLNGDTGNWNGWNRVYDDNYHPNADSAGRVNGNHVRAGNVYINIPAVNTIYSTHVNISGWFSAEPSINVTAYSTVPGSVFVTVSGSSASGFDIYIKRTDGAYGTYVYWSAIGS